MLRFLAYSNLWISIGAASFSAFYWIINDQIIQWNLIQFVFGATLTIYSSHRYFKEKKVIEFSNERKSWQQKNKLILQFILAFGLSMMAWNYNIFIQQWKWLMLAGIISVFYAIKIPGIKTSLREIAFVKIFLIAFVWSIVCVVLPIEKQELVSTHFIYDFLACFLFILSITIPFDIRDIKVDSPSQRTIPQLIGIHTSRSLALIFLVLAHVLWGIQYAHLMIPMIGLFTISGLFIYFSHENRHDLYFSIGIDGLLILYPLVLCSYLQI